MQSPTFFIHGTGFVHRSFSLSGLLECLKPGQQNYPPADLSEPEQAVFESKFKSDLKNAFPNMNLRRLPTGAKMALLACKQTYEPEQPSKPEGATNTGLYIGTANGATESTFGFLDSLLSGGARAASPTAFTHSVNNAFGGLVAALLGMQGPVNTCSQGGLSLYGAFLSACSDLAEGIVEEALVGVVEEAHPMLDNVFSNYSAEPLHDACAIFFRISRIPPRQPVAPVVKITFPSLEEIEGYNEADSNCLYSGHCAKAGNKNALPWYKYIAAHAVNLALAVKILQQNPSAKVLFCHEVLTGEKIAATLRLDI